MPMRADSGNAALPDFVVSGVMPVRSLFSNLARRREVFCTQIRRPRVVLTEEISRFHQVMRTKVNRHHLLQRTVVSPIDLTGPPFFNPLPCGISSLFGESRNFSGNRHTIGGIYRSKGFKLVR